MFIAGQSVDHLISLSETLLLQLLSSSPLLIGRNGGYICVASRSDGQTLLIARIGTILSPEKSTKYARLCQEKAVRLYKMAKKGHVSSWQSRKEAAKRYAGAIVAKCYILAFSGLPEKADEALMVRLAIALNIIGKGEEDAGPIATHSQNEFLLGG